MPGSLQTKVLIGIALVLALVLAGMYVLKKAMEAGEDKAKLVQAEEVIKVNDTNRKNDARIDNAIPVNGDDAAVYKFLRENARQ